jgi:uncharacterized protein YunC (DUF1805 family)
MKLPTVENKVVETQWGQCIGHRAQWDGGQYCGLITNKGIVGCGAYDVACCERFGMIVAIARGTPQHPLVHPEDLFDAAIVDLTTQAARIGIQKGMAGKEALRILLQADSAAGPAAGAAAP